MKKIILFLSCMFISNLVLADSKNYSLPKKYVEECGSCHIAYPGELLPKSSWKNIVGNLSDHYGNNASLDKREVDYMLNYLNNVNTYRKAQETNDNRITTSNWFKREHLGEARLPKNEKFVNCNVCHKSASTGNYSLHGYKGEHDD